MNTSIELSKEADKAKKLYENTRFNCAQSILKNFQEIADINDQEIIAAKSNGGGRAPDGMCGALFAALNLIKLSESQTEYMKKSFAAEAGALKCREIRSMKQFSCAQCVWKAAQLAAEIFPE